MCFFEEEKEREWRVRKGGASGGTIWGQVKGEI